MSAADLQTVGSISLLDLDIISNFYGRDFLPYPFMFTRPSQFAWHDDYVEYARSVPDRFNYGDLRIFKDCATCYANADISVECHIQHIPADTPSIRAIAARRDQAGFLATQRPDDDVIDVYRLSPYLLGPAIAEVAGLQKPGRRSAIIIPEYVHVADSAPTSDNVIMHNIVDGGPSATEVPDAKVTAFGTVQSHWRPTKQWGRDREKNIAVWVRIEDDGDYLYQPDFSEAKPLSRPMLAERIDLLITQDVKALRQFRNS
jgi:hypothetical protein